jgi:hypothetical protein
VFVGYSANGVPRWEDFAQHCLDRRHPEVDRLYDDPPAFVTLVRDGHDLSPELLAPADDRPRYRLCGQVAAGFFPVRTKEGEGRGVLAVTFQLGVSLDRRGGTRWGLNVLGCTPQGETLDMLWERHDLIPGEARCDGLRPRSARWDLLGRPKVERSTDASTASFSGSRDASSTSVAHPGAARDTPKSGTGRGSARPATPWRTLAA